MNAATHLNSRRQFIKRTAAVGLAGAMPAILASCGDSDDGATPGAPGAAQATGAREARHLHFDLSMGAIAAPRLVLPNSTHHGASLAAHTMESRRKHRALNPLLADVDDDKLTHYLEDVDLPAQALQLVGIHGKHPATGAPMLVGHFIHVPTSALQSVARRRASGPARAARSALSAKMQAYGVRADAMDAAPIQSQIAFNSPAWDVATTLVFQHPQITNLNPDLGAEILDRIQNLPCDPNDASCTPYLGNLAFKIATMIGADNYPTTTPTGSWAVLVPVIDEDDGSAVLDDAGNPLYSYQIDASLSDPLAAVVKSIMNDLNDDPLFAGSNWQPSDGGPATQPTQTLMAGAVAGALTGSQFSVQSGIAIGKRVSGIRMAAITASDNRAVRLTVRNEFIRSASTYVEFRDANGTTLPVDNQGGLDTDRAKFLSFLGPDAQIMGVPFQGSNAPATNLQFTMPAAASQAVVYFGGLGLGGSDAFSDEALPGAVLTLVINIGLPAIFLTYGIISTFQGGLIKAFTDVFEDPITMATIVKAILTNPSFRGGIQNSIGTMSIKPFLISMIPTAIQIFLKCAPRLSELLAEAIAESAVVDAVPILGVALYALSAVADIATLSETIIECVSCPAIDRNVVTLTMSSTVRISRDPRDFQFPASARRFHIDAYYDGGKTPRTYDGTIAQGQVDPIDAVLTGVPSGGKVAVHAHFYSDQGCLVGVAASDPIVNLPDTAGLIPLTIREIALPLDASTTYQHSLKLLYQNGAHAWAQAPAAQLTHANLCQGSDAAICALNGLTVHTASGMAGYGFSAGGQGVNLCGGGQAGSLNTIRNVFLGNNPDSGLKFPGCGFTQPVGIVYDPLGPAVGGHHFFLQPDNGDNYYHLRSVKLDNSAFDLGQTLSWGRFMNPLDSLTVTSNGYVVGVNRVTHKMEVLLLPSQAVDAASTPNAIPFSALKGGKGTRAGLLDTPVAVASYSGVILVLEQGNRRVQAFDHDGSNVNQFTDTDGKPTPLMSLGIEDGVTYLDLAVEGAGYLYVLSYAGSGSVPSSYRVDVYTPAGGFLSRTTGVAAGAIAVDLFRNLYTLNYESVAGAPRVEPSLSQWLPRSATACPTTLPGAAAAAQLSASCVAPVPATA